MEELGSASGACEMHAGDVLGAAANIVAALGIEWSLL